MLGEAPGTERLGEWVASVDGGMSLEDLANHIAASDAFQATYPNFSTNQEFAEAFLGDLMGGENVSAALMSAAVEIVVGLLNDGMTRGALALAAVNALLDIAMDENHAARGDLGGVAVGLYHRIDVAKHYTLEARMADPSSDVLAGVTSDPDTAMAAKDAIDNPPAPPESMEGQNFVLTPTLDDFTGGDNDDTFVAQPVTQVSSVLDAQQTLNPFDRLDGGDGNDTVYIYGVDPNESLDLGAEDVSNIENVVISTVGGISADLTDWEGVEMVNLRRFGDDDNVTVMVDDGTTVSSNRTFGRDATIVGASGTVDIEAGSSSNVVIGSGAYTDSVMVKGGASVKIGKNADGGGQSATVTSVDATGVKLNAGTETSEPSGTFAPLTDTNGFLTNQNGSARITVTYAATAGAIIADGSGGTAVNQVGLDDDGVTLTNAFTGVAITSSYNWDHDGDESASNVAADPTADPPVVAATAPLVVTTELKFGVNDGSVVFGKITGITGYTENATTGVFERDAGTDAVLPATIQPKPNGLYGETVPVNVAFTSAPIGKEDAAPVTNTVGAMPTLTINSDAIADVMLASTDAIVLVNNNSKTADGKNMPENLSVTVNKYGTFNANGSVKQAGKLCIDGAGSAETIMIDVEGASVFDLASDEVKTLNISGDGKLVLGVKKFDNETASDSLASVTVSGAGGVTMNSLDGMKKLASIDASGSSGKNSFKSEAELAALTMVKGGSGSDTVELATSLRGKLASIDTGDGGDTVMIDGDYSDDGLMVDLGAGDDTFHGGEGNGESRIYGGDGEDTLRLSEDGATYKDGDDTKSIYHDFEILDVGGGQGEYNVGRLGVHTIVVNKSTEAAVTLENVGGGTSLEVSAESAGMGTTAEVAYNFADDVNVAGSLIDGGTTNILNVSLMARGGNAGTRSAPGPGAAVLEVMLDSDLLAMTIDSSAIVHGAAAGRGVTSGHYRNEVDVQGTASALQEVKITGNAMTELSGDGLTSLQYVNATESGAGVVVDASANTGDATSNGGAATRVRLAGSDHKDTLTAGDFDGAAVTARNVLMGNGGNDMLTGGEGKDLLNGGAGADELDGGDGGNPAEDRFIYNAASESQVTFSRNADDSSIYDAKGYDVITGFTTGAGGDKLHFSKALHAIVTAGEQVTGVTGYIPGTETPASPNAGVNYTNVVTIANGIKTADEWVGWRLADRDGDATNARTAITSIDGDAIETGTGITTSGATNLHEFIGDGRGLFLTAVTSTGGTFGATTRTFKNSIALITQDTGTANSYDEGDGLWLLIDVDKDGDFDAETDMVIFLAGSTAAVAPTFAAATDISS